MQENIRSLGKKLALGVSMYQSQYDNQLSFEEFELQFGGRLRSDNRWVRLAKLVPWEKLEKKYARQFSKKSGRPALPLRVGLGALIIKARYDLSDEDVVEQISENPYLQYFLGYTRFEFEDPFDSSYLTYFRKRIKLQTIQEMTEMILDIEKGQKTKSNKKNDDDDGCANNDERDNIDDEKENDCEEINNSEVSSEKNDGALKLDATVAPADITYPTDTALLNKARLKTEAIIDAFCVKSQIAKPRTYRRLAKANYMAFQKQRKPGRKKIRKTIKQQLQYIRRNIKSIKVLAQKFGWNEMIEKQRDFWIVQEVYNQQLQMYQNKSNKVEDRIVSISQPHVRPIVRGKAGSNVEFGAKLSASVVDGYVRLFKLSWNAYNEGLDLIDQVEDYKKRYGHYPEVVQADKIYGTRKNRKYLKLRGIRFGGACLGREPKNDKLRKARQAQRKKDGSQRIEIEGKFGIAKRKYPLDRIKTKLSSTSEVWIATIFLTMNLFKKEAKYFCARIFNWVNSIFLGTYTNEGIVQ